jgi:hypothetical protein
MGLVGFLFGIVAGGGGRLKIDRAGILAFLGVVFFLLADPLTGGQIFYQISLFLGTSVGGTPIGSQANNVVEGFMNNFMTLFGTLKTQAYLAQHGTVLYFAGAVPFAFYSRLRKTTATFLALGSAAVAGLGYIRIANQDLDIFKVLASFVPGVLIGLLVVLLFVGASSLEDYLRKRLALS